MNKQNDPQNITKPTEAKQRKRESLRYIEEERRPFKLTTKPTCRQSFPQTASVSNVVFALCVARFVVVVATGVGGASEMVRMRVG